MNAKALYRGEILQSGVLDKLNPAAAGIEINAKRRYAFNNKNQFPVLEITKQITQTVLNNALFFVTIQMKETMHEKYIAVDPCDEKMPLW